MDQLGRVGVGAWAALKRGYDSREYPYVIADLIRLAGVTDEDTVVLDEVDNGRHRADYREMIRMITGIPALRIQWAKSVDRKEIQVCDALAGAISRGYTGLPESCMDRVVGLLTVAPVIIEPNEYRLRHFGADRRRE